MANPHTLRWRAGSVDHSDLFERGVRAGRYHLTYSWPWQLDRWARGRYWIYFRHDDWNAHGFTSRYVRILGLGIEWYVWDEGR